MHLNSAYRTYCLSAGLILAGIMLGGCLHTPPGTIIPCPPPQIIELYPEDGSDDFALDDTIIIVFDHPVDTNTVDTTTIIVIETSTGDTLIGDVFPDCEDLLPRRSALHSKFSARSSRITGLAKTSPLHDTPHECGTLFLFDPQDSLKPDEEYTITITTGIEDTAGIPLEDTITFTFTTEDTLPDPPPWVDVYPEQGGEDIPVDTVIIISFDDDPPGPSDTDIVVLTLGPDTIPGSVTWDPADSTLTFDPVDTLLGDTTYTVTVTIPDDCVGALCPADSTYTWTFTTEDPEEPPPPAPVLIRKLNGSILPGTPITGAASSYHWSPVAGALTYHFQVSTSPTFGTLLLDLPATTATSYVSSTPIHFAGNTYYWRVSATNSGGTSAWSAVWTFTHTL